MISSSRRCGWLHATGQNPFGSGYSVFQDLLRTWDVASVEPELGIERGFPGSRKSDSRCWLGNGGQHGWASHIRLTFGNGFRLRSPSERASNPRRAIDLAQHLDRAADRTHGQKVTISRSSGENEVMIGGHRSAPNGWIVPIRPCPNTR